MFEKCLRHPNGGLRPRAPPAQIGYWKPLLPEFCPVISAAAPNPAMAVPTLMMAVPAFFARLAGAPDEPAVLFSREFFGRAYSMSNDGWVMTWASLALTSC